MLIRLWHAASVARSTSGTTAGPTTATALASTGITAIAGSTSTFSRTFPVSFSSLASVCSSAGASGGLNSHVCWPGCSHARSTSLSHKMQTAAMSSMSGVGVAGGSSGLMRAVILREGSQTMTLENLKIPEPKAGEVLIRNKACGVCHTDLHVIKNEVGFPKPCVLGHETTGEIVAFGPDTGSGSDAAMRKKLKIGDRVVSSFIMPCGGCYYCEKGQDDLCETFFEFNRGKGTLYDGKTRLFTPDGQPIWMYSMGGLAEYSVVPWLGVYPLTPDMPYEESCILGCAIFTAYGALRNGADLRPGESVAVIGSGGIGSNVLQLARAFGASSIIAVDIDDNKLKAMKALGATHVVNAAKENVTDVLKSLTNGRGVDVAIEALGKAQTFQQAVLAVRDGGRAVMVGIAPMGTMAQTEITRLVRRQIRIIGSYGGRTRTDLPAVLSLVKAGYISASKSITKRYALSEAAEAYRALDQHQITGRAIVICN